MRLLDIVMREAVNGTDRVRAAVAVIFCKDKILLGLSTSQDGRRDKWCFPGGGLKGKEDPSEAAEREAKEETNVRCRSYGKPLIINGIAFVKCRASSEQTLKPNHEFMMLNWFTRRQLKGLKLFHNVLDILDKLR